MPGMDGYEFLKIVHPLEAHHSTKILVSSASVTQEIQQTVIELGGHGFFAKPIDAEILFDTLA